MNELLGALVDIREKLTVFDSLAGSLNMFILRPRKQHMCPPFIPTPNLK